MRMIHWSLLAALLLSAPSSVLAAGFDCSGKLNLVEGLICDDAELSKADGAMAEAYSAAARKLDTRQRARLRQEQREWVARRNEACKLSDFENESNRIAGKRCISGYTTQRTDELQDIEAHGLRPVARQIPEAGVETYHGLARKTDTLSLKSRADGAIELSIITGSARGACGVALTGRQAARNRLVFRDVDSDCTVTVTRSDAAVEVTSIGNCSGFCGVHAGFVGAYARDSASQAKRADPGFAPIEIRDCGKPVTMDLANPKQYRQFHVDLSSFRAREAATYAQTLASLCRRSDKHRALVERKVRSIALVNAQGAMEPTPYLRGPVLRIEFVGGEFDAKQFERALRRALEGKPPVFND